MHTSLQKKYHKKGLMDKWSTTQLLPVDEAYTEAVHAKWQREERKRKK